MGGILTDMPKLLKCCCRRGRIRMRRLDRHSFTALMAAIGVYGHAEVIKVLIAGGAEVNQRTRKGTTALDIAKEEGHAEIVRILQAAGARE